mgnify:FL=1
MASKRQRRSSRRGSGPGEVPLNDDPPFEWADLTAPGPDDAAVPDAGRPGSGAEPAGPTGGSRFGSAATGAPPAVPGGDGKRRVARRAKATTGPRVVAGVVVVTVIGALVAALWTGSVAPTGNGGVDALERALLVAVGALAGSRARRWPMFVIAALAAVLAEEVGLALALGGVAAATALLTIDRRNRVVGAVAGAAVTLSLMELRPVGPLGFTVLIGAVLYLAMCVSGYQRLSGVGQRRARWAVAGVGAFVVIGLAVAGVVALGARNSVETAVDDTRRGAAAVRDGETGGATELLNEASAGFEDVSTRLGAVWLFPARMVPGVAQNVDALRAGADMGSDLNGSAAFAATSVDYQALRQEGGGVNLAQLKDTEVPVEALASSLDAAVEGLADIESPWVVAPLRTRLDDVAVEVGDLASETELAQLALADVPPLLGADGPRRYLAMVGNPAEGRDFGGFMGGWALLWVNDGAIGLEESGTPRELYGSEPTRQPPSPSSDFPPSFIDMAPGRYTQNWTSSPDLDVVAAAATNLMEANGRGHIDGVIYADPAALAEFVALTGPIAVPGTVAEINATNTEAFFTRDQFRVLPQDGEDDEAIGELTGEIFDRLGSADLPGPRELGERFGPLVRDGHLAMATGIDDDRALLDRTGLSAPLPATDGDLLGIVERNVAPNKMDVFLNRTHNYDVAWDDEDGARIATLTSTYTNDVGDPARLPPVVVGNESGTPIGTQIREVSILTPSLNASLEVEGERTTVRTAVEQGIYRHSVFVRIPPGQSIDLRWRLESTLPPGPYDLTLVRPANGGATETNVVVREGDRNVIDETVAPGRTVRLTTNQ